MENSDRGRFNWNDGSDKPRGRDSGPISPRLPLVLNKLHVGDTRVIAWLPFEGTVTYNEHSTRKSTFICREPHSACLEKVNFPDEKDLEDFLLQWLLSCSFLFFSHQASCFQRLCCPNCLR